MTDVRGRSHPARVRSNTATISMIGAVLVTGSCQRPEPRTTAPSSAVLRVGWGQGSATSPISGVRQPSQILTVEGLARTGEDGRMMPSLAEGWTLGSDGRSLTVALRPKVKFHDGSPVDSAAVARLLPTALKTFMGPMFSDVDHVKAVGANTVEIAFRESAPFHVESLEVSLQKPNGAATGPFVVVPNSTTDMVANENYYLGPSSISRIHVESYPSAR